MGVWLAENLASIVLLLVVIAIAFFLVRSKIKQRIAPARKKNTQSLDGTENQNR